MGEYIKYPRTPHFSWSNPSNDDKIIESLEGFEDKEIIISEKMDGECTSMYIDHIHARSTEFLLGDTCSFVKVVWNKIRNSLPKNWRVCGENMQVVHSIPYDNLKSYFLVYSIWNEDNVCLSWKETEEWCELLGLTTVPILYKGMWNEQYVKNLKVGKKQEGYVVRITDSFKYKDFNKYTAKYVRPNHVQTDKHWKNSKIVWNKLEREGELK
jgi:hypothetical protein